MREAAYAAADTIHPKNFIMIPPEASHQGEQESDTENVPPDFEADFEPAEEVKVEAILVSLQLMEIIILFFLLIVSIL